MQLDNRVNVLIGAVRIAPTPSITAVRRDTGLAVRRLRTRGTAEVSTLGIRDRRCHVYCRVMVGMPRRRPIDLVVDRTADNVAWLRLIPGTEVVPHPGWRRRRGIRTGGWRRAGGRSMARVAQPGNSSAEDGDTSRADLRPLAGDTKP